NARADQKAQGNGENQCDVGVEPERTVQHNGEIHAEHHKIAVSEVDGPHDTENQGEAHANQSVDRPYQNPVGKVLKEGNIVKHGKTLGRRVSAGIFWSGSQSEESRHADRRPACCTTSIQTERQLESL